MAFELDPVLRYGEFAVKVRTNEGIFGDGIHRASQLPVYTGVKAGPTIDSRFYAMYNGRWVAIRKKAKPASTEPEPAEEPTGN